MSAVLSCAEAVCRGLADAMVADPTVVTLGEDIGRGGVFAQYRGLREQFGPQRVIDTPISESTIMGAAVGMALAGLRPVVELRVVDFALCAIDEIVNQAAKTRYMLGGQARVPVVIRLPGGIWSGSAAQHSQSLEAWFAHIPGLVVVMPATPVAHYALLQSAIASDDPVLFIEHKELWGVTGEVPLDDAGAMAAAGRIGKAHIARAGTDLTVCSWSRTVHAALEAAERLAARGISVEVIDLQSLWPWDRETVLASAARTGRLLVTHEAVQVAGFGAEIVASVAEALPEIRVRRLGAPRIPVGYSPPLEAVSQIDASAIAQAIESMLGLGAC
jgi:pyruvate dehydrogenase E1 component beta subunit